VDHASVDEHIHCRHVVTYSTYFMTD